MDDVRFTSRPAPPALAHAVLELWHLDDPGEYHNRTGEASFAEQEAQAAAFLRTLPAPRPGPANRPRALLPQR